VVKSLSLGVEPSSLFPGAELVLTLTLILIAFRLTKKLTIQHRLVVPPVRGREAGEGPGLHGSTLILQDIKLENQLV
jgi:hypothetical protein